MIAALHDFWFWAFWLVVLLLIAQDRFVAAYRRLAHGVLSRARLQAVLIAVCWSRQQ